MKKVKLKLNNFAQLFPPAHPKRKNFYSRNYKLKEEILI